MNRVKSILAGCIFALLLGSVPVMAEVPQIDREEFPEIDGSLACVPMIEGLIRLTTRCSDEDAGNFPFTNTNPSYINLAEGNRDLIIAYEPSKATKKKIKKLYQDMELEKTPVGKDALVFLVSAENPVDSLTTEQLVDIFTGKITNWSEVGGVNAEILVFERPEDSGSQTLMRKLLMENQEMVGAQKIMTPTVEGRVESLKSYDNSPNAIGYSVYYYAAKMMADEQVKILEVDGVAPDNESIRSGEYSLCNPFYCVTSKDSSETAIVLRDWLISEEGQAFVESCGYVGILN